MWDGVVSFTDFSQDIEPSPVLSLFAEQTFVVVFKARQRPPGSAVADLGRGRSAEGVIFERIPQPAVYSNGL